MLAAAAAADGSKQVTPLPVKARKRSVFLIHCSPDDNDPSAVPPTNTPLTVDSSMAWFRSEGSTPGTFLCGMSPPEDQDPDCHSEETLQFPDHSVFEDMIWPALYHRVPAFERLKVKSFWSGFYEYNTLDQVRGGGC
jgi:glycine/D-amino acid oxidase-like deaminating enzyme